jgi:hypothetical protein
MRNQMAVMAAIALLTTSAGAMAAEPKPAEPAKPAADAPAAAPSGKPAPENDIFKKSIGTWSCEGSGKGPDGAEMKYKSTWNIKSALGGHWHTIVYKRSKMGPMPPFEGNATVGYDTAAKKYLFIGFDNRGGRVDLTSADAATYTGEGMPMGKKTPVKFSFTPGKDKKGMESDKLFDVTLDLGVVSSTESCKK